MSEKDDFVEELFRDLPKSKAFNELDIKRHEKLILAQIEDLKLAQAKKQSSLYVRFQTQFRIAAGFLVIASGLAIVLNQSSVESGRDLNVAISEPTPTVNLEEPTPEENNSTSPAGKKPLEINDEMEEFNVNQSKGKNYINSLGLDYFNQFDQIIEKIQLSQNPISLSSIPTTYGKCAIEHGINTNLIAIDKGFYDGQSVIAFYSGNSRLQFKVYVLTKSCEKIAEF